MNKVTQLASPFDDVYLVDWGKKLEMHAANLSQKSYLQPKIFPTLMNAFRYAFNVSYILAWFSSRDVVDNNEKMANTMDTWRIPGGNYGNYKGASLYLYCGILHGCVSLAIQMSMCFFFLYTLSVQCNTAVSFSVAMIYEPRGLLCYPTQITWCTCKLS